MERYTKKVDGKYIITDVEEAANLLGKFEDLYEYVKLRESTLPTELEKLRSEGKEKSYKFKEVMAQKLLNTSFIVLMHQFDIDK